MIDKLLSILMIGAFFTLLKIIGYFVQKKSDKNNVTKEIAGKQWTVIREDKHEIVIGDKASYSEEQMIAVIKEIGNNHDIITFMEGGSTYSRKKAGYMNGVLVYEKSGKAVDLRSAKE